MQDVETRDDEGAVSRNTTSQAVARPRCVATVRFIFELLSLNVHMLGPASLDDGQTRTTAFEHSCVKSCMLAVACTPAQWSRESRPKPLAEHIGAAVIVCRFLCPGHVNDADVTIS